MPLPEISERYLLPVDRPDWDVLLGEWGTLLPPRYTPWLLTKFGELFVEESDGKIGMLQVSAFRYEVVAKDKADFQQRLAAPDKVSEWFLGPLGDQLEAAGKTLSAGKCYSFITPLGLGGEATMENVMIIPVQEHFLMFGDVYRQIKDLPDGAQIEFKIGP